MIVGIMQPYFFPYIGYFSLINYSDRFVFFDTPQYISHGWVNRNRILNAEGKPVYITVPIKKAPRDTAIKDIDIVEEQKWIESIFGKLSVYKRKAPYYDETISFIRDILDLKEYRKLSDLNCISIKKICEHIGIDCIFDTYSEMNMNIGTINMPDEWALRITQEMGGDVYVNPPGGISFFDKTKYDKAGIELRFLESNLKPYIQRIGHFEKSLSIIDVMMYCSLDEIHDILNDYTIIK